MEIERTDKDKEFHDSMVSEMIGELQKQNIDVLSAELKGYSRPDKIYGKIPDIIGQTQNDTRVIVEVETCEYVDSKHTEEQFRAFSTANGYFWVAAPRSCIYDLRENANVWGTKVDHWHAKEGV